MRKVRLSVSDPTLRELLCRELEQDAELVLLLSARYSVAADVLVVDDERRPEAVTLEAIAAAQREHPDTRVVLLAAAPTAESVQAALAAGASGVVARSQPMRELVGAIRVVAQGGSYICPGLVAG